MNKLELEQLNYQLRRQNHTMKARIIILTAERDAARDALINFNQEAALQEMREKYGLFENTKGKK